MSIAIVNQVYDETRRIAIAGSGFASGDFRLKKLVAPLEKAAEKAPIFGKVAQAISNAIESDAKSSSGALLELSTLVSAILYTQGRTGAEGKLKPIETGALDLPTADSSARVLKPLIEALTTTGSGRMEVIIDAEERGAFRDLRLVKPALMAIDDVYGEIGDFVEEKVLPIYGKAIVPELRQSFNVKGKSGHVRRLRLMNRLDPEGTRDLVEEALESGSKEMKIAAIACLKQSQGHLPYLLEQTRAKVKDVRRAAFSALAQFTDDTVIESLIKAITGSDLELAAGPASENRSPKLLRFLLEEAHRQLGEVLTLKDKAKRNGALTRFYQMLGGFEGRQDKQTVDFLIHCFDQRDAIAQQKGAATDGDAVNLRVASLMIRSNDKTAQKALVDSHETLAADLLRWSLIAAMRTRTPDQVYKLYSPYYLAGVAKKRGPNPERAKQEVIRDVLQQIACGQSRVRGTYGIYVEIDRDTESDELTGDIKFDRAWLDAAVRRDDLPTVQVLAEPKHQGTIDLLSRAMDQRLAKAGDTEYESAALIRTMIRIEHPQAVDYFVKALESQAKRKSRYHYVWWLVCLIPDLPKSAVPKIEALLPDMNERIVDEVIPRLEELKTK